MDHFKGKQFQKDVIIVAVGYYLRYNLSGSVAKSPTIFLSIHHPILDDV